VIGDLITLEVERVAHGGICVGRHEGRVVFVRHTAPGERVVARITDGRDGDRFLRGDAVEILRASPARVEPRCSHAHPGGCGGCDWQHLDLAEQRRLKADVVVEQFQRLAHLDVDVEVEVLADDRADAASPGLGWRTRVGFGVDADGALGLRRHRSHDLEVVEQCPIAHPAVNEAIRGRTFPGADAVEVAVPTGGPASPPAVVFRHDREVIDRSGPDALRHEVHGRPFSCDPSGFWQVHPGAAECLVDGVLEALDPRPGETALDLYAGVGLFAAFLADAVGPTGRVLAVEGSPSAIPHAQSNLAAFPHALVERSSVEQWVTGGRRARARGRQHPARRRVAARAEGPPLAHADLVVLDPPRAGANRVVIEPLIALTPRAIAYVACDPAALARDTALLADGGYRLATLRAFDLFPMTHHIECLAGFVPA
jgi:tRNA/tmRNA/rRNA uracil-C5-methylase (TrmA/RlmC/RlmD family)